MSMCASLYGGMRNDRLSKTYMHYFSYENQGFIQDFRFGGETQHLGGSGGMVPQEKIFEN